MVNMEYSEDSWGIFYELNEFGEVKSQGGDTSGYYE